MLTQPPARQIRCKECGRARRTEPSSACIELQLVVVFEKRLQPLTRVAEPHADARVGLRGRAAELRTVISSPFDDAPDAHVDADLLASPRRRCARRHSPRAVGAAGSAPRRSSASGSTSIVEREAVRETQALHFEVVAHEVRFTRHGDEVRFAIAQRPAQQVGQPHQHLLRHLRPAGHERHGRIQRVEQEVRVELHAQRLQPRLRPRRLQIGGAQLGVLQLPVVLHAQQDREPEHIGEQEVREAGDPQVHRQPHTEHANSAARCIRAHSPRSAATSTSRTGRASSANSTAMPACASRRARGAPSRPADADRPSDRTAAAAATAAACCSSRRCGRRDDDAGVAGIDEREDGHAHEREVGPERQRTSSTRRHVLRSEYALGGIAAEARASERRRARAHRPRPGSLRAGADGFIGSCARSSRVSPAYCARPRPRDATPRHRHASGGCSEKLDRL